MNEEQKDSLFGGYRVLDLTDEKGLLCGKIFGDLGADVIKIETPGGDAARNIGPFYKDIPHPEKSLYWFALNLNKRGITLNIESSDGMELFKRLVNTADIVVESYDPGYLDSLGLGYASLKEINPRIILTSITPFGQTGPYANRKGTDIVGWATSGMMSVCGDSDRSPIQVTAPQAYLYGGLHGAMGTAVALYHREMISGQGQHVDTSIQEGPMPGLLVAVEVFDLLGVNLPRMSGHWAASRSDAPPLLMRFHYPCKDGYITWLFMGGSLGGAVKSTKAMTQVANRHGKETAII